MKKSSRSLVLMTTLVALPLRVFGQDASSCTELLTHGLYDRIRETSESANAAQATSNFCSAYNQWKSSSSGGGGGLSIPGIGGLSGSYSQSQAESVASLVCHQTGSSSSGQSSITGAHDRINPEAVGAWRECVALNAAGLKTKTSYREADQLQMTVELWYVAPVGAPPQTQIDRVVVSPANGMTCSGTLMDAATGKTAISTSSIAMSCERKHEAQPIEVNGRKALAPPSSVTVMTKSGTFTRYFGAVYAAPPPVLLTIPVGTILPFHGTVAEAETLAGSGWMLCDNRLIQDPSSPLNGTRTPDLRGVFLYGSNKAGDKGGSDKHVIPSAPIDSYTYGFGGTPIVQHPRLLVHEALSFIKGTPYVSRGQRQFVAGGVFGDRIRESLLLLNLLVAASVGWTMRPQSRWRLVGAAANIGRSAQHEGLPPAMSAGESRSQYMNSCSL